MTTHTIKWTDVFKNLHFLHNRDGHISLILFNGTPMHLSNIDGKRTEELRMALSACGSADEMVTVMKGFGENRVEAVTKAPEPAADPSVAARTLWSHEGGSDVSELVKVLAEARGATSGHTLPKGGTRLAINDLTELASELTEPVSDWVLAAKEAGWRHQTARFTGNGTYKRDGSDNMMYEGWQDLCENEGISPILHEVCEHLVVSDRLADMLEARGEKVGRGFSGLSVWAKTTHGPVLDHPAILAIAERYEPSEDEEPVAEARGPGFR